MATMPLKDLNKGIAKIAKRVNNMSLEIQDEAIDLIHDALKMVEINAARRVPVDTGALRQSIIAVPDATGGIVKVTAKYAPYVEFGTGTSVSVPADLSEYAKQFKGAGVRKVNLPARPFFFPAYREGSRELIQDLKKLMQDKTK